MNAETQLIVSDADKPLAYLDLSDEALGRFARWHIIQCEKAHIRHASSTEMPLSVVTSMHAAIALYRLCDEAGAGEMTLTHEGVSWRGKEQGNWQIAIQRNSEAPDHAR